MSVIFAGVFAGVSVRPVPGTRYPVEIPGTRYFSRKYRVPGISGTWYTGYLVLPGITRYYPVFTGYPVLPGITRYYSVYRVPGTRYPVFGAETGYRVPGTRFSNTGYPDQASPIENL